MPLLAGPIVVPPIEPYVPVVPIGPGPPGVYVPTWHAPDGTVWQLNPPGPNLGTLDAVSGLGIAPVEITADPDPIGGTRVRHVQAQARLITWPMRIRGQTHMQFLTRWREYAYAFAQTRRLGPGTLRLTRPDGTSREIDAYYESGWEVEPGQGWLEDTPVIGLYCPDPFWRGTEEVSARFAYSSGVPRPYLARYITVASGSILGVIAPVNPGNVEAWPTWTLEGPADEFTALNVTTGESFTLTYSLGIGETVVIVTRPNTITGPLDANLINDLDWPSAELFRLEPGINNIDLQVLGSGATTAVTMSFPPRYETS